MAETDAGKRPTTSLESTDVKRRKMQDSTSQASSSTSGQYLTDSLKAEWEREPPHYPQLTPDELWCIVGMHLVFDSSLEYDEIDRIIHLIAER